MSIPKKHSKIAVWTCSLNIQKKNVYQYPLPTNFHFTHKETVGISTGPLANNASITWRHMNSKCFISYFRLQLTIESLNNWTVVMHRHDLCIAKIIHVLGRVLAFGWSEIYLLSDFQHNLFLLYNKQKLLEKKATISVCLSTTLWRTDERYSEDEWFSYLVSLKSIFQTHKFQPNIENFYEIKSIKIKF